MAESGRLSTDERKEAVLLEARKYLLALLGHTTDIPGDEAREKYLRLIKDNPWLEGKEGDRETPLTRLRESLQGEYTRPD